MHPALLVDEILRAIFHYLPPSDLRWTYAQLARCCTAWRDAALDLLWMHLPGMEPVLSALRSFEDGVSVVFSLLQAHNSRLLCMQAIEDARSAVLRYTGRVKAINHKRYTALPDALRHCSMVFPHLESVVLFSEGCMVPHALATSTSLKHITINIGFPLRMGSISELIERSDAAALFLHHARVQAPGIQNIVIRGRITSKLNAAIASYTQLRTLCIRSTGLRMEAFVAIATSPSLETLELVVLLQADEILSHIPPPRHDGIAIFPALRNLTIRRAVGPPVEAILCRLPVGVLVKLHLEMEACAEGPSYMRGIFQRLADQTSASLRELTVEDRTSSHDLQSTGTTQWYNLDILHPLARLRQLRRSTLR